MGITIVQKSDLTKKHPKAKKALILAGGAVTGGSFKAGGIKALSDYLKDFKINDFDIFVGISSGSLIAAALMAGISPESIVKSLDGTSEKFEPLKAWHYYRPNFEEFVSKPAKFIFRLMSYFPNRLVKLMEHYPEWSLSFASALWGFVKDPTKSNYDEMMQPIISAAGGGLPSLMALLPSGLFDNRPIEEYIRKNIERNGLVNDFAKAYEFTNKKLYITAMRLDGAKRVIFGPDEDNSVSISEAIQASTALPGFYKPAHINGRDYVDGGIQETAHIDTAVEKGAELIICYNPFRPYEPEEFVAEFSRGMKEKRLATEGILAVLNQIFRAAFHSRLRVALDNFRKDDNFKGDIILIEPRSDDMAYFLLNPLSLKNRIEAARLGFESVRNSIEEHYGEVSKILSAYGITMNRLGVEEEYVKLADPKASKKKVQKLLEGRKTRLSSSGVKKTEARGHSAGSWRSKKHEARKGNKHGFPRSRE